MRTLLRSVFSLLVLILAYVLLIAAFHRMNLPSNLGLAEGVAIILVLFVAVPTLFHLIWRKTQ